MGKVLPEYLSLWTTNKVKEEGVNIITNAEVENVEKVKDQLVLTLNNGSKVIMVKAFLINCHLMYMYMMFHRPYWYVYTGLKKFCEVLLADLKFTLPHYTL
jgi:hypothetical protein